nr:MAG TPA: hypothetical protein [Caudoviricetes sp.]
MWECQQRNHMYFAQMRYFIFVYSYKNKKKYHKRRKND